MELMMTYETTLERLVDRIVQRQYLLNQDPISDFDRAVRICGQTQAILTDGAIARRGRMAGIIDLTVVTHLREQGQSWKVIAQSLKVDPERLRDIVREKAPELLCQPTPEERQAQLQRIEEMTAQGLTYAQIAQELKVHETTIGRAVRRLKARAQRDE
jgi:DNA-binding NarL/FixJ family response regulator